MTPGRATTGYTTDASSSCRETGSLPQEKKCCIIVSEQHQCEAYAMTGFNGGRVTTSPPAPGTTLRISKARVSMLLPRGGYPPLTSRDSVLNTPGLANARRAAVATPSNTSSPVSSSKKGSVPEATSVTSHTLRSEAHQLLTEAALVRGVPVATVKSQADKGREAKPGVAQEARVGARGVARGQVRGALPREGNAPLRPEETGDLSALVKVEVEIKRRPQRGVEGVEVKAHAAAVNPIVLRDNETAVRKDNGAAARRRAMRECACA